MREDALIAEVRRAAQLPDSFADYTDAIIRTELNTQLQQRFARIVVKARVGMMLKRHTQSLESGTATYPLPNRAMSASAECLSVTLGTSSWPLEEILPHQVWQYEQLSTDRPRFYVMLGSSYRLYPTPNAAYTLKLQYYLRPSRIVAKQSTTLIGQIITVAGDETDTQRSLTVSSAASIVDADTATFIATSKHVDIVRGTPTSFSSSYETFDSSYEVVAVDVPWDLSGFDFVVGGAGDYDLSEIQVGDFVRPTNQSEWPTIPHEYHPALAWATAAKICRDRGMANTAQSLEADVAAALRDLADDIQPRVKSSAQSLIPRAHMLRRGGGGGYY